MELYIDSLLPWNEVYSIVRIMDQLRKIRAPKLFNHGAQSDLYLVSVSWMGYRKLSLLDCCGAVQILCFLYAEQAKTVLLYVTIHVSE
jgi:hypothetical protein